MSIRKRLQRLVTNVRPGHPGAPRTIQQISPVPESSQENGALYHFAVVQIPLRQSGALTPTAGSGAPLAKS